MSKIRAKITMGDDRSLNLNGDTMNEIVDKIKDWQLWESQALDYYEKKGTLEEEKKSGWYFFEDESVEIEKQREIMEWLKKSDLVTFPEDEIQEVMDDYRFYKNNKE